MGFNPVLCTTTTTPYRIKAIQYPWRLEQCNKDNSERLKAWLSELYDKVGVVDVPLDEFLERFIPCDTLEYLHFRIKDPFTELRGLELKEEKEMYDPLVNAFNTLMLDIHGEGDRLTFLRRDKELIPNPYKELAPVMSKTFPDIIGVLPGMPVDEEVPWAQVRLVVEVKGANHLDPMGSESQQANADLVQIAESALNLLSAHGAQYAYILHDMGSFACIYRFDHASAVMSCRFNYITEHVFISKFFYRLLHPSYSDQVILNGQDNFSFSVSESFVKGLGIPGLIDKDLYWNRILTLLLAALDFLTLRPIHFSPQLFSQATRVGEALLIYRCPPPEDRRLTQGEADSTPPLSRCKGKAPAKNDTWSLTLHGQARGDDADNFSMAVKSGATDLSAKRMRVDNSMDSSADQPEDSSSSARNDLLGDFQVKHIIIKEQYCQTERINEVVHYDKINAYLEKHNIPRYGLAKMLYGEDLGETFSFHITVSATAKNPKDTGQIHEQMTWKHIQRFGNVMLVCNGMVEFCGFIDDLDYGSPVDSSKFRWKGSKGTPFQGKLLRGTPLSVGKQKRFRELENKLKERTGTVEFMAMELIDADPENDVVLHHTKHNHSEGDGAFMEIFGAFTPGQARRRKENMLLRKIFTVKGNAPLSYLLQRLQSMVYGAYIWEGPGSAGATQTPVPLKYDTMLEAFDKVLGMEGWLEDDAAITFKTPYSEMDGGMDIKTGADAGIIGTSSHLRKQADRPALPTGAGNAPSSPSKPQDAESTPTRPKCSTG
ncbi:hypothetical protein WOLCODRAFT_158846 [Wolfiporia cocos MD-104 SS10]|uniref:Fungal-type protein kinase domain-containing protein n=1 Tax=Wolfiporia cocos (strain MD-104) TaxID=742152 RepID=A0A2H3JBL3_WOLCO|nr:hypothetical protein WOLCODRAFT_158846 [Wolfiporia cocos MD-104 SS10]